MQPSQLEKRKSQLIAMRQRLTQTVNDLEETLREDVQAPGEISTVRTHPADVGAEGLDKDVALAQNAEGLLEAVNAALARIEEATYGTCHDCGAEIAAARIEALPYTPYCVQCAARHDPLIPPDTVT